MKECGLLKPCDIVLLQDNAAIRHALAAAGGQCVLPRKKRRTYGFVRGPDGGLQRVAREAEDEFAGTYEEFLEKVTAAAKRGMKLGREDFERLNPEGVAFLKLKNAFEEPYTFSKPAGLTYVSNEAVKVVEPTGLVDVDADVLRGLEEEGEEEVAEGVAAEEDGLVQPAETELVDGVEEEGAAEEERVEGGRQNWPNYLVKTGDAEKIHLQRALHLMQPRVEKPSKDRSRRYIAANFLPGFRPVDGEHDLVRFRVYAFKDNRGLH
jgi:hypothetical protein